MKTLRLSFLAALGLALLGSAALAGSELNAGPTDRPLVVAKRVVPHFPARTEALRGQALVIVEVDAAGKVVSAQVVSATNDKFAAEALAAANATEFQPALKDGRPVASWARLPFKFERGALAMR